MPLVLWTTSTASGSTTPRTRRECSYLRRVASCSTTTRSTSRSRTFIDVNSTPFSTRSVSATLSSHRLNIRLLLLLFLLFTLVPWSATVGSEFCLKTIIISLCACLSSSIAMITVMLTLLSLFRTSFCPIVHFLLSLVLMCQVLLWPS